MSVTIYWRPAADDGTPFKGGTSTTLKHLEETFGSTISVHCVPILRGMARASGDKFYDEVADVVEKVGDIQFHGVW